MDIPRIEILKKCPICFRRVSIGWDYERHQYAHYNYCEYGHYEEFEVGDPRWPKCKNEED